MRSLSPRLAAIWVCCLVTFALTRVHIRVMTTEVAYHLGHLKGQESQLLEQRSRLQAMQAKMTTKHVLENLSLTVPSRPMVRSEAKVIRGLH